MIYKYGYNVYVYRKMFFYYKGMKISLLNDIMGPIFQLFQVQSFVALFLRFGYNDLGAKMDSFH